MRDFFNYIIEFINTLSAYLQSFGVWILDKVTILFWFLLEQLLTVSETFLTTLIDATNLLNTMATNWSAIPIQSRYYIETMQIPTALAILLGAYATRLVIKLIPGT